MAAVKACVDITELLDLPTVPQFAITHQQTLLLDVFVHVPLGQVYCKEGREPSYELIKRTFGARWVIARLIIDGVWEGRRRTI
jgi:hypothetical protein